MSYNKFYDQIAERIYDSAMAQSDTDILNSIAIQTVVVHRGWIWADTKFS